MQRREALKQLSILAAPGGLAVVGSGSAKAAESAASGVSAVPLERRMADFALRLSFDVLPPEAVTALKRIVLDTLACAYGATNTEPVTIATAAVRAQAEASGGPTPCTVIGQPTAAALDGAVFINGVQVRTLDLNDTYLGTEPLHPSELLPTALGLAEAGRITGREFLAALAAGYEVSMRVCDAVSFMARGFHPLCALSYGAPLIAGRLWRLNADQLGHAVGLSAARGYTSFVVNSGAISMMKAMGFAASAADVLFTTRLAARGFTGPTNTLEWFASRASPRQDAVNVDLEPARWRLPRVAFKRFPIQIELAAVAEAGTVLSSKARERGLGHLRTIQVGTYPGIIERVADAPKFRPQTRGTADHSLPVCLALGLVDGDVTLAQFERDRWRDAEVMRLVEKTVVQPDAALMAQRPKGRGASVTLMFDDGSTLQHTVDVPEGDAERPMSDASLARKFTAAAEAVVGAARTRQVMQLVDRLETVSDMSAFAAALRAQ